MIGGFNAISKSAYIFELPYTINCIFRKVPSLSAGVFSYRLLTDTIKNVLMLAKFASMPHSCIQIMLSYIIIIYTISCLEKLTSSVMVDCIC